MGCMLPTVSQAHPRFLFFFHCHVIIVTTLIAYTLAIGATFLIFAQFYEIVEVSLATSQPLFDQKQLLKLIDTASLDLIKNDVKFIRDALVILLLLSWLVCGSALYGVHKKRRGHLIPLMIATTLVLFVIAGVVTSHGVEAWLLTDETDFARFFYLFLACIGFLTCFLGYMYLFAAVFRSYEYLGKLRREPNLASQLYFYTQIIIDKIFGSLNVIVSCCTGGQFRLQSDKNIVMEAGTSAKVILLLFGIVETAIGGFLVAGGVLAIVYLSWLHTIGHGIWGGIMIGFVGLVVIVAVIHKKSTLFLVHTVLGAMLLLLIFPSIIVLWALELDVDAWSSYGDPDWCLNGCDYETDEKNRYYNATNFAEMISNSLSMPGANLGAWGKFRQAYLGQHFWPERRGRNILGTLNNGLNQGEIPCDSIFWEENCHKNMSAWFVGQLCLCLSAGGAIAVFISICLSCCTYAQCFGDHHSASSTRRSFSMFHSQHSPSVSPMPTDKPWYSTSIGEIQPPQYENIALH